MAAGAIAGLVGTLAMSTLMLSAQRLGALGEQPPRRLSDAILDSVIGGRVEEGTRRVGTSVVHLAIGASAAALHQVGRGAAGRPAPAAVWGGAFGAIFWAVNYGVFAPAVGLMPPPDRDRPGRAPVMLAANVIWGAISAVVGDRLAQARETSE